MLKLHYKLDAPSTTDGRGPSACCLSRVGQQGSEHAYLGFSVEAAMTATTSDMKQHTSKVWEQWGQVTKLMEGFLKEPVSRQRAQA